MADAPRPTQAEKAALFRALHEGGEPFVIPNPFDAGSARILAGLGFKALATTSGGFAGTLGFRDGSVTQGDVIEHARTLANAVDIPVSADLENGFGHTPEAVAETVRLAAAAGLAGGSIEDYTGDPASPLYDLDAAVGRIAAAVQAARSEGRGFVLTARAEGYLYGDPDPGRVIERLQAYEAAGADVLMAPGIPELATIERVCASIGRPFNFTVGLPGPVFQVAELVSAGVHRISLGSSLWRAAMGGLVEAAKEAHGAGTFTYLERAAKMSEIGKWLRRPE